MPTRRLPSRLLAASALLLALTASSLWAATPALAFAPGVPLTSPFPRTAVWWPVGTIPASALARYDVVILADWERTRASQVRALHPAAVILDSTNACELPYAPDDPAANAALRKVPAAWLLTQVGSQLAAPVSASATSFRVAAVTGPGGLALFRAGDSVVVGDEVAYVASVSGTTLTVRRGRVRAATPHPAGARVASAVSYWGDDLVLDLSPNCPALTVDAAVGPETWGRYNARVGGAMLADPVWDGLLVDRSDGDESWLVVAGAARSIDPSRANRVPTSYAAFDAAWDAGLRDYEQRLRARAGDGRYLVSNWGRPGYDLLNGNVFEAFPSAAGRSYNGDWRQTTFGPLAGFGGYLEWMRLARQPALSVLASYRFDAASRGATGGTASEPLGPTDFRKARFGLGTALLGDGAFSYGVNDSGRGSLQAAWFDEYDGGGLGRGYLGEPLGAAYIALPALTSAGLVANGGFDSAGDLAAWELMLNAGYTGGAALDAAGTPAGTSAARVTLTTAGGKAWRAHFTHAAPAIASGQAYTITFWAKADRSRAMSVWLQGERDDTRVLADFGEVGLGTTWRRYEVAVQAVAGASLSRLHFGVGESAGSVWIDGVRLQSGRRDVWRRDFGGGTVVVNATPATGTVALGGRFRHIAGGQDPAVNDGSVTSTVTLGPLQAVVLLRTADSALNQLDAAVADWRRCQAYAAEEALLTSPSSLAGGSAWSASATAAGAAADAAAAARVALAASDSASSRARLDAAVGAAASARAALARCRVSVAAPPARRARAAASSAAAHVSAAHDSMP